MFLNNFGHRRATIQVGIKCSMEGCIKYLKINMVGKLEARVYKCNKINYIAYPLRIPGISDKSTSGTSFLNTIKPMQALDLPIFLWHWNLNIPEFRSLCNWYSTAIGSSAFQGRGLPIGQLCSAWPMIQSGLREIHFVIKGKSWWNRLIPNDLSKTVQ